MPYKISMIMIKKNSISDQNKANNFFEDLNWLVLLYISILKILNTSNNKLKYLYVICAGNSKGFNRNNFGS
jgi:pyruvate-formate lyase